MGCKNGRMVAGIQYFAVTQYLCFNNGRLVGGIQLVAQSCHIILSRTLSPYTISKVSKAESCPTTLFCQPFFHIICSTTFAVMQYCAVSRWTLCCHTIISHKILTIQYSVTKYIAVTQSVFKQYPAFRYHLVPCFHNNTLL